MARLFFLGAALPAGLLACSDGFGPGGMFLSGWARWNRLRPAEYTYDFRRSCYCLVEAIQPVRISVVDGQVTGVVTLPDLVPVPPEQVNQFYRVTLDSVFAIIRHAIDEGADDIDVRYDPMWGYPTTVAIDYLSNAIDEELSVTSELQSP